MLELDGSRGEGGGQVLRTALTLSMVTGHPFRMTAIRAGRPRPGLRAQHLTAARAAAEICTAYTEGVELGSKRIVFEPGVPKGGQRRFSVGTAGSATLVLQTVLPALAAAGEACEVTVEGGTHNPSAPPFEFLRDTWTPALRSLGLDCELRLERHGFFPAGGGVVRARIVPSAPRERLELLERGPLVRRSAQVLISRLPSHVGERERRVLAARLGWPEEAVSVEEVASSGPGNVIFLAWGDRRHLEVFTGFGERGKPAERVAEEAADRALRWRRTEAPVGEHTADQLLLLAALGGGGTFRTAPVRKASLPLERLSSHGMTNAAVIREFLPLKIDAEEAPDGTLIVQVGEGA